VWDKISWRFYFVYIAWDVVEVIFIYFLYVSPLELYPYPINLRNQHTLNSFVETKGRTLEAINEIFEAPYPKNKSIQKHVVVVTDRGILDKGLEDHF
jgi:hypothetical protein